MAQHQPSLVVLHRRRRLTFGPTLRYRCPTPAGERGIIDAAPASLGGRNTEERRRASPGGRNPGEQKNSLTRWRVRQHRRLPSFPWGTKPRGTPNAGEHGIIDAAPVSLGGRNPEEHKTLASAASHHQRRPSFPWGTKPQGTKKSFPWGTKPRGQQQQQRPTFEGAVEKRNTKGSWTQQGSWTHRIMDTAITMDTNKTPPNLQGCG